MKTAKNKLLLFALCSTAMLSACKEERPNPILSKDTILVSNWLLKNYGEDIEICATHWSDPKNASKADLNYCKPTAKKIADKMNHQGFLQDVRPADLSVTLVWMELTTRLESNRKYKKEVAARSEKRKKALGGLYKKLKTSKD